MRQDPGEPWDFEPSVDARAFRLLGFVDTSAGIARTQRQNRAGWWEHARRHKAFILDAAAQLRPMDVTGVTRRIALGIEAAPDRDE